MELILFVRESEKTEKDPVVCCPQTRAMKNVLKPLLNKAEVEHRISFENLLTADIWRHNTYLFSKNELTGTFLLP